MVERGLDFSHMRDYLRRTLSGQLPFFSLAPQSAVGQLVARGAPRLTEAASDARRELERELKITCEGFIMAATKLAVEPMLSFVTKVTAARVAGGGAPPKPLREQVRARVGCVCVGVVCLWRARWGVGWGSEAGSGWGVFGFRSLPFGKRTAAVC